VSLVEFGHTDERGYVFLRAPLHPLATRNGLVPRHRIVCWSALGRPQNSPCHWCGYVLPWKISDPPPPGYVFRYASRYVINVDHVNGTPGDDRRENLVPSCWWCNINRSWLPKAAPKEWDRLRRLLGPVPPWQRPSTFKIRKAITGAPLRLRRGRSPFTSKPSSRR
jgi:hypothetical protein